ncbi:MULTISPECIES: hypothetical protein [Nocardiaceae]|uniref:Uncharacterized protein n=1 Tax=Rhodococcoides corynebacterioides TaxID=53972 RepID=A0ABS2KUB4_9NOCA|nr:MULTISPECIES: hypothetical protein [Rhodococcus]MBM7415522.1 hypothetical protein [Rhodococcus corynebacterioides]MBP1117984.1 hypothetical protein [Rhodococcus sp. PvP016]
MTAGKFAVDNMDWLVLDGRTVSRSMDVVVASAVILGVTPFLSNVTSIEQLTGRPMSSRRCGGEL